jgi:dihydrodipicolinate synthase/N-acetylneuraminate lyase
MNRNDIKNWVLPEAEFPLWVPLLTHYRQEADTIRVDAVRMLRHASEVCKSIDLWMIAGTTGDGWQVSDEQFAELLNFSLSAAVRRLHPRVVIGTLRPTTEQVLERISQVRRAVDLVPSVSLQDTLPTLAAHGLVGITVCPPVGSEITQRQILVHYAQIAEMARMPIVVYQLPQVTGNTIAPDTMAKLVQEHPEIILFKDSSGTDAIAKGGLSTEVCLLRGAEGNYAEMLKPLGGYYDGFLLSTGNTLGRQLRALVEQVQVGRYAEAVAYSTALTELVQRLFDAVKGAPAGNPFSNANRAIDHIQAYGRAWRNYSMPLLVDGSRLPEDLVTSMAMILEEHGMIPDSGYLSSDNSHRAL